LCKLAKYLAPQHSAYSAQQKIKCNNQGKSTHAVVNVVVPFWVMQQMSHCLRWIRQLEH
jgi:hypothetical protein